MLKKCISVLLVLMMLIGVFSVLPLSASAEEADDAGDTVVDAVTDDVQSDDAAEDQNDEEALVKEESDLADVGADEDIADDGADVDVAGEGAYVTTCSSGIYFSYSSKDGCLYDNDGYRVIEVGNQISTSLQSGYEGQNSTPHPSCTISNKNVMSMVDQVIEGKKVTMFFKAKSVGFCKIYCEVWYNDIWGGVSATKNLKIRVVPKGKALPGEFNPLAAATLSAGYTQIYKNITNYKKTITVSVGSTNSFKWDIYHENPETVQNLYTGQSFLSGTGSVGVYSKKTKSNETEYFIKGLTTGTKEIQFTTLHRYSGKIIAYVIHCSITVVKGANTLDTPKITGGESLDGGVKLKWNSVSGAVKYRAFYKNGNGWTKIGDTTNNYIVFPNVYSGYTLTYTVRCINSAGTAYTSGFDSGGFRYTYNMARPTIKSFSDTSSGVTISIGTVSNAKRYRVFVKNGSGWAKVGDTTGSTVTHTGAVKGRTYTYTVRCMKSDGSRFTSPFNATGWSHTRYLGTPSVSKFADTSTGTYVYIKAVSGAVKYRVFYKNGSGWTQLGDTTTTSFFDKNSPRGAVRTYTVRCMTAANAYASNFNATGWSHVRYLDTPSISKGESVSTGMKLTIKAVTGAVKYRVFYKVSNGWQQLGDTTTTSFTDTTAVRGAARTYTVRCMTAANAYASNFNANGWSFTYRYPDSTAYPVLKTAYMDDEGDLRVEIEDNTASTDSIWYYAFYVWKDQKWNYVGYVFKGGSWIFGPDLVKGQCYTFMVRGCDNNNKFVTGYNANGFTFTI